MPSAASVAITGRMTPSMTARSSSGVTSGEGEYAPMPPVLGPVSASPSRLWSCDEASGARTRTEAAQPRRREHVGDAMDERQLGADDGAVDVLAQREIA